MEVGSIEYWQTDFNTFKFVKVWSKGYPTEAICVSYDKVSNRVLVGLDDGVIDFILLSEASY